MICIVTTFVFTFYYVLLQISFQHLLKKQGGKRAAWEYPFAVAGVNITFMIMQMLDLDARKCYKQDAKMPSEFDLPNMTSKFESFL